MVQADTAADGGSTESGASGELSAASSPDVQATFCATLVDEWLRLGVCHAVVAPGSRSTPMALALAARDEMAVHVVHDERVAAFSALGLGIDSGVGVRTTPALLLCTSGTAAANFYPAVVEAGLSEIPMIVLTADRPEELRGVGAPQTIDQIDLYGKHVRWFHDPGVPDARTADGWRHLAHDARSSSTSGPVHLNLPFREPLVGRPKPLPLTLEAGLDASLDPISSAGHVGSPESVTDPVPGGFDAERGVILVGGRHGLDESQIVELRHRTAWPMVADPMSGLRHLSDVTTIDALLRSEAFAARFAADTIVRIGRPSTSKLLAQWTARPEVTLIQVGGPGRIDPAGNVAAVCSLDELLDAAPTGASRSDWLARWQRAELRAGEAIDAQLAEGSELTEPSIARTVADHLPAGAQLTVSSSMPVRDLEWYGGRAAFAHSNRGANGIDGVISTALGRALGLPVGSPPSFVLIGDLAFVHDSNAMVALAERNVDLRIVVVDNDGGGIFSFLPQAELLHHDRFEQLFGTPLGADVLGLAAAHGVHTATASSREELAEQLARRGPWVCRVRTDREDNVRVHRAIHEAVAATID